MTGISNVIIIIMHNISSKQTLFFFSRLKLDMRVSMMNVELVLYHYTLKG